MFRRALVFVVALSLLLGLLSGGAGAEDGVVDTPETVSEELDGLPESGDAPAADAPDATADDDAGGVEPQDGPDAAVGDAEGDVEAEDTPAAEGEGDEADVEGPGALDDGPTLSEPVEAPMPFTMLGAELPDGAEVWVRSSADGDQWTEWIELEALDAVRDGPDEGSAEERAAGDGWKSMSDAVWVGEAAWLQLMVDGASTEDVSVTLIDSMGLSRTLGARIRDAFSVAWRGGGTAHAADRPAIPRSGWGADESLRRGSPSYASDVEAVTVHHTAGSNTYTREQAPGVVRGIYHYHTVSLGWNDIGYNMLADRFGRLYEGRFGGLERAVIGAHAGGFNTGTFGISIMGTFTSTAPSSAAFEAVAQAIGWKAALHRIDPNGQVQLTSRGSTRYPSGTRVVLPTIFGHRDVSATECPGERFYRLLPDLRARTGAIVQIQGGTASGVYPLSGDWNGNGRETPGWYANGRVYLRNFNSAGPANITYSYGRAGDVPIVGDWNGDGRDTLGIIRGREWHLRFAHGAGPADLSFIYGRVTSGDYPFAGDWNGDGRDTVGVVRDGEWHLRNVNRAGRADIVFVYGRVRSGDIPFVGDWNGDGRDTPGIVRGSEWHLRMQNASGRADHVFRYGRAADRPVVGDWNANGQSTPGIVRDTTWHLRNVNSAGAANLTFIFNG